MLKSKHSPEQRGGHEGYGVPHSTKHLRRALQGSAASGHPFRVDLPATAQARSPAGRRKCCPLCRAASERTEDFLFIQLTAYRSSPLFNTSSLELASASSAARLYISPYPIGQLPVGTSRLLGTTKHWRKAPLHGPRSARTMQGDTPAAISASRTMACSYRQCCPFAD